MVFGVDGADENVVLELSRSGAGPDNYVSDEELNRLIESTVAVVERRLMDRAFVLDGVFEVAADVLGAEDLMVH